MAEENSYGDYGLMQSGASFADKKIDFTNISDLDASFADKTVWIRGRLHTSRVKGKSCFAVIRHQIYSVQICGFAGEKFTKEMLKFIGAVPKVSFNF
jgi:aspartyl-tRNA synthetase